jgi:hypothetical protein
VCEGVGDRGERARSRSEGGDDECEGEGEGEGERMLQAMMVREGWKGCVRWAWSAIVVDVGKAMVCGV